KVETTLQGAPDEQQSSGAPSRAPSGKRSPLGMTVSEISPGIARELGNPSLRGVAVMSVEPESPAVEALDDYAKAVRALAHGEMIRMLVRRDGKNLWVAFPKR